MLGAQAVQQEIEARNQEFMAAFKRGDAAGVAAGYADDARLMPPGGQAVTGRQAIEQFWRSVMDAGVREVELRTERAEADGDLAYEIGSATLRIRPEGGAEATDAVKYVVVWTRRTGGPWQLTVDIWNSNNGG
jgi:uncharacterized protein (TIGR02246 family)